MLFKRTLLRIAAAAMIAASIAATPGAEEVTLKTALAYLPPNHGGYEQGALVPPDYAIVEADGQIPATRDLGNGWGGMEAKVTITLAGIVTEDEKCKYKASAELSPISVNALGQLSYTPAPFAVLECGSAMGTGWSIGSIRGLAINPTDPEVTEMDDTPFGGMVWSLWGGTTLQADLAAVVPGAWNHVIARAGGKIEYRANSGASEDEAWLWEADSGENFNGFRFVGSGFLGYQMPIWLSLVGVTLEATRALGDVKSYAPMKDHGGWGSDFCPISAGIVANAKLGARSSLTMLVQAKRKAGYTDETVRIRDFRQRDFDGAYWYLNRIALVYSLQLSGR